MNSERHSTGCNFGRPTIDLRSQKVENSFFSQLRVGRRVGLDKLRRVPAVEDNQGDGLTDPSGI